MTLCFQPGLITFFFHLCLLAPYFNFGEAMGLCAFEDMLATRKNNPSFREVTFMESNLAATATVAAESTAATTFERTPMKEKSCTTKSSDTLVEGDFSTALTYTTIQKNTQTTSNVLKSKHLSQIKTTVNGSGITTVMKSEIKTDTTRTSTKEQTMREIPTTAGNPSTATDITTTVTKFTTEILKSTNDPTASETLTSSQEDTTSGSTTIDEMSSEIRTSEGKHTTKDGDTTTFFHTIIQKTSIKTTEVSSTSVSTHVLSTSIPTTSPSCPTNMVYMNCTCQTTCEDPNRSNACYNNCAGEETCLCPVGFYLNGEDCVLPEECGCYFANEGVIVQEGDTQLSSDCTQQCSCIGGVLSCNGIQCNSDAKCENKTGSLQCYCNDGFHGNGISCTRLNDCQAVYDVGLVEEDVYTIFPTNWPGSPFQVYCKDGWTVFQRRTDGSVVFYRNWIDYKEGFGDIQNEMWLGLEKLHYLTNSWFFELKISLAIGANPYEVSYNFFRVDSEANNYTLQELGSYNGDVAPLDYDFMKYHHTYSFSTYDRDNDIHPDLHCAEVGKGGWWYKRCWRANLNGQYGLPLDDGGLTLTANTIDYMVTFTEMSIKPA